MKNHIALFAIAAVVLHAWTAAVAYPLVDLLAFAPEETLTVPLPIPSPAPMRSFTHLPLSFVRNDGQADPATRFEVRGRGYLLSLEQTEAVMALVEPRRHQSSRGPGAEHELGGLGVHGSSPRVLRMELAGANADAAITGEGELPGKFHYFIGNDPTLWRTNVSSFAKVRYREVYPGIDLVYYGNEGQLEYDFVVAPGADPGRIELAIEGADVVEVDRNGDLRLEVAERELHWRKPVLFQEVEGVRVPVAGEYVLRPGTTSQDPTRTRRVAFRLAPYDRTLALVIDPVLAYSTYLGGGLGETAEAVAVDSAGCAYLTGQTFSRASYNGTSAPGNPFPTTSEAIKQTFNVIGAVFVTKLNSAGDQIVYSTVLCGASPTWQGSLGTGIAVDAAGMAVITGTLDGADFPTKNAVQPEHGGGFSESFVAKLSSDGSALVFSTFLGGNGYEWNPSLALDEESNICVAGQTSSPDFRTANALQATYGGGANDLYLAKLAPDGTRFIYSTFLGGTGSEMMPKLAVDSTGRCYIAADLQNESSDYLAALSAVGSTLEYSTLLPNMAVGGIAVDRTGAVYLTGSTASNALPTTPNAFQHELAGGDDVFVAKLSGVGPSFEYLTYVGGSASEAGLAIAIHPNGDAYVGGTTRSPDFPTADPVQAENKSPDPGGGNAFVFRLNRSGSNLMWSTYLGGTTIDGTQQGRDVVRAAVLGADGALYLAGSTASPDFPVLNAFQENLDLSDTAQDAFVTKIVEPHPVSPSVQITRIGSTIAISWPLSATGFDLETSDSLAPAPKWTLEPSAPEVVGDQNVVTLEIRAGPRFFRLRQP